MRPLCHISNHGDLCRLHVFRKPGTNESRNYQFHQLQPPTVNSWKNWTTSAPPTNIPHQTTMADDGIWTADELMHGKGGAGGDSPSKESAPASPTNGSKRGPSLRKLKGSSKSKSAADPMDWGVPGHLTEEEVAVFVSAHSCCVCGAGSCG
jgi:hypothetical protein